MPKVEHPRRKKTQHRSLQEKYKSCDKMQHSTWDKGEAPRTRATVTTPKTPSFTSRLRTSITKAARGTGRAGVSAVRSLLSQSNDPKKPFSLVKTIRQANLVAALAAGLAKKKKGKK